MMIRINFWLMCFLGMCVFLASCASQNGKVYSDYDPDHSFSGYKSFSWAHENPMIVAGDKPVSPLIGKHIMNAIKTSLSEKGIVFIDDSEKADFVVSFSVGARDEISVSTMPTIRYYDDWRFSTGWGGEYRYGRETIVSKYTQGSIAIDVFDVSKKSPVWHGIAEGEVDKADKKDPAPSINSAVKAVLNQFPPI